VVIKLLEGTQGRLGVVLADKQGIPAESILEAFNGVKSKGNCNREFIKEALKEPIFVPLL